MTATGFESLERSWTPQRARTMVALMLGLTFALASCGDSSPAPSSAAPSAPATEAVAGSPSPTDAVASPDAPPPVASTTLLAGGDFEPIGYSGRGTATLVETEDGDVELRFEGFKVEQGPKLRVYLSSAKAGSPESRFDDDFADLGDIQSFKGDQTYEVPRNANWEKRKSVVIWCAEFSVGFIVAPLDKQR